MRPRIYNFHDISAATHKEVGVAEIMDDAIARGLDAVVVISSGNYIQALSDEGQIRSVKVLNLVNDKPREDYEIRIEQGRILRTPEERVEAILASGFQGNVKDYTDFVPTAYAEHANKILEGRPDYVLCPIGSGKLWLSIVRRIEEQGLETRVVGFAPAGKNPFFHEFREGEEWNLRSLADKLTSPYTALKEEVLSKAPTHRVFELTEREILRAYAKAQRRGVICEPSGAVGFAYYQRRIKKELGISRKDSVRIVSSGSGLGDQLAKIKKRRLGRGILFGAGVALGGLAIAGLVEYGILRAQTREFCDLNGDGRVTAAEIYHVNEMAGEFWDEGDKPVKREAIKGLPRLPNSALRFIVKSRKEMIKELSEDYNDPKKLSTLVGRQVNGLEDLTFNELRLFADSKRCADTGVDCNLLFIQGRAQ